MAPCAGKVWHWSFLLQETVLSPASLNTWRAHTKARAPATLLQKHRLIFCSLFLPGIGQQCSWPQLQRSKIREAPWHRVARGSPARKQNPMPSTYLQLPPHCLVPHSPCACSVSVLQTSIHFPGCCMCFWSCLLQKNENELNIILISSQQWTAGPGRAAVFPASPHFVSLPFAALTLLQTTGKAGLMWILDHFLPLRHHKLPLTLTVAFPVLKKSGRF